MKAVLQCACLLIGGAMFVSTAEAALVTHNYVGTIKQVRGPQPPEVAVGTTINLSYTVDAATADQNSLPSQGIFFGAMQSLRVELPGREPILSVSGGTVQTFDNTELSGVTLTDTVLMFNGTINQPSEFGGLPVYYWQLILQEVTPLDVTPTMLNGDVFPTEPIAAPEVYLQLQTTPGYITTLLLELKPAEPAAPTVPEVVTDAKLRIDTLVEQGQLGAGVAQSIVAKLDVVLQAFTTERNGVCGPLVGLRNQVGNLPRRTAEEAAVADELAALVAVLTEAVGTCSAE
ncbi:hypothetical protein ACFFGH_16000 [Lysobacter korlensis]|uniref:Uncharacterized protein n=1 Tax=Lysobacter korlensis TaxID=553636 RepID=A0ABV6RQS1_9GAMM